MCRTNFSSWFVANLPAANPDKQIQSEKVMISNLSGSNWLDERDFFRMVFQSIPSEWYQRHRAFHFGLWIKR